MKVLVGSCGTHGDVQPAVAFARELGVSGFDVRFASHPTYQRLAEGAGIRFLPLGGGDPKVVMKDVQTDTLGRSAWVRLNNHLFHRAPPPVQDFEREIEACRGHDVVLSANGFLQTAAESLGLKTGVLALYPTLPTACFPHHLSRMRRSFGGLLNRLSHFAIHQLFWQPNRGWVNQRRRAVGLPAFPWRGPSAIFLRRAIPHFYGFSPVVIPKPRDWGAHVHVTGFWFLDTVSNFQPPPALVQFLENGPPPVVVCFGSLVDPNPEALRTILLEAIGTARVRAIVLSGWSGAASEATPPGVFQAEWVPLPWLLPRAAALVHHAGIGTLAEALRAGVPSVAVPYSGEQSFWASRLHALGAAPPPLPRARLQSGDLAACLIQAVEDHAIKARLAVLKDRIAAEDGLRRAVTAFQASFGGGAHPGLAT